MVLKDQNAYMAAPLCTQRIHPYRPVLYKHTRIPANDPNVPDKLNLKNEFIDDYEPNSVIEVDGIGYGVVLKSNQFLRKMAAAMPQGMFFSNTNGGGGGGGGGRAGGARGAGGGGGAAGEV